MPNFLGGLLGERIFRLRKHMQSERRPLAFSALATRMTSEAAALGFDRRYNAGTLQRWETDPEAEPDLLSLRIMAKLAGVPLYEFAVGQPEPAHGMVPVPRNTSVRHDPPVQDEASVQLPTKAERDRAARQKRRTDGGEAG